MKRILITIFIFCCLQKAEAQTDTCVQHLKDALTNYNNAQYDKSISLLNIALKNCPLDKQDKIEAYKLLILAEINIDNLEEADKSAEKILSLDPTFKPDKLKDDAKLITEFAKFKPSPVFAIGIYGGMNNSSEKVNKTYSVVYNDDKENLGTYKSGNGFQLGLFAQRKIIQQLWLSAGFCYSTNSYEHSLDSIIGSTVNYSEKLSYFNIPVQLKYYFLNKSIQPYLYAGANFSFLNAALSTTTWNNQKDLVDRVALRNSFATNYCGGVGINYNRNAFNIFLQTEYDYSSGNLNKDGTRYDDEINLFKYYYVDDDFSLNHMSFSIGASYNLLYRNKNSIVRNRIIDK